MDSEPVETLSVGSVVGGTGEATRRWRDAIKRLAARVAEHRVGIVSPLNVNVVFQVPGEIIAPDFEGVRAGSFSRRDSLLMVQAAVPRNAEDEDAVLRTLMLDALNAAEAWALRKRLADDLGSLRGIAERATEPLD